MDSIFSKNIQQRIKNEKFRLTIPEAAIIKHISLAGNPKTNIENLVKFFNISVIEATKLNIKISQMIKKLVKTNSKISINNLALDLYPFVTSYLHGEKFVYASFFTNEAFKNKYGLEFKDIFKSKLPF